MFSSLSPARRHLGFTLVELLGVVALVALLAGLILGASRAVHERGRIGRARAELTTWSVVLENYRSAHGRYPSSLAAVDDASLPQRDPWGQPYRYAYESEVPWTNPRYVLYSAGPDGVAQSTLRPGGYVDFAAPENADNISAGSP